MKMSKALPLVLLFVSDSAGQEANRHRFPSGNLRHDSKLPPSLEEKSTTQTDEKKAPKVKNESGDTIGLAFMGGSYTAANVGSAIMRGFQQQTITINGEERPAMEGFDYTGGLSGGNFPSLIYSFAQNVDSNELLDASGINDPSQITKEDIESIPKKSIFSLFTDSVWNFDRMPLALLKSYWYDEHIWVSFVYEAFLKPCGIPRNKFMASEKHSDDFVAPRDEVKSTPVVEFSMTGPSEIYPEWLDYNLNNVTPAILSDLAETATFAFPFFGFDVLALNDTALLEALNKNKYQTPIPFIGTPDEIGTPFPFTMEFDEMSGKTAQPLDLPTPFTEPKNWSTESRRFGVESLLALGTGLLPIMAGNLNGLPDFLMEKLNAPMEYEVKTANNAKRSLTFADGGYNEGSGVPCLVAKKVRKIISVSIATPDQFGYDRLSVDPPGDAVYKYSGFFGTAFSVMLDVKGAFSAPGIYSNHIFDLHSNGENQLLKLYDKMESLYRAGNPMIATLEDLTVVENPFWGTVAGEKVDLTVIQVMGVPSKFSDQISHDVAPPPEGKNFTENGFFSNEDLMYVPNLIHMSFEGPMGLPDFALNPKGARMTSFLGSWMIKEAWEGLEGADGETKFDGFKKIFEG